MTRSIHPYPPNSLTGSRIDRAAAFRSNSTWVAEKFASSAQFAFVWRGLNLMRASADGSFQAEFIAAPTAAAVIGDAPWAFMGNLADTPIFAADLSHLDEIAWDESEVSFRDLRRVGGSAAPEDAALMAHARGLMHWRLRNRFCGVCGAVCNAESAGHEFLCSGCGAKHFPRTDPAVIMLVTHGARILLGQPASFRARRVFTTLAGFVEPGESLEEAVAREVFEETGIRVGNVRYQSSQPWPFPASVMVGFRADALDCALTVDETELVEARWFTRDEVRAAQDFVLPPDFSIARRLIDTWLAESGD